jgi:peptidase E
MNLALSSDFPSTANTDLVSLMRSVDPNPRIAWVSPAGAIGPARFPLAQAGFLSCGLTQLERISLDAHRDAQHFDLLDRFDIVYLSGGDPVVFRQDLQRCRLDVTLREFAMAGRLIVGASGGAMQLTSNVSLFRLLSADVEAVMSNRPECAGLGFVDYELLPHLNRHDAAFLEKVRRYSERVPHDVVALADGAVAFSSGKRDCRCSGHAARYRGGRLIQP